MNIGWMYDEFHEYTMKIWWVYHEYTMIMPWVFQEYALNIRSGSWVYDEITMSMMDIRWIYVEYSMSISWIYDEFTMSIMNIRWIDIQWVPWYDDFHEYTMGIFHDLQRIRYEQYLEYKMSIRWVSWILNLRSFSWIYGE